MEVKVEAQWGPVSVSYSLSHSFLFLLWTSVQMKPSLTPPFPQSLGSL